MSPGPFPAIARAVVRIWDLAKKERIGGDYAIHVNDIADLGITADKKTARGRG